MACENDDNVVVTDGPSGTAIELTPSNTTVLRRSSLSINCTTDANPIAHVFQFYLDDVYIGNSSSGVFNVTVTADGAYTCVPVNTVGKEQNATVVITTVGKCSPRSHYILARLFKSQLTLPPDKKLTNGFISLLPNAVQC